MKEYWVSTIIQNEDDKRAWMSAMSDSVLSIEEAMEVIKKARKNYIVLSAWIDTFDENDTKHIVFHECYVDALGGICK